MEEKNQYKNLAALTLFLLILANCLKPALSWEIADPYSVFHKIMFFAQWIGMLGVFVVLGMYWRVREMNWKTVTRFLLPCISLYALTQVIVFAVRMVFCECTERLSFVKAADYTGYLSVAIGGTLFLWAISKCRKKYLVVLLVAVFTVAGIMSGCYAKIGTHPYLERLILGLPFMVISFKTDFSKVIEKKKSIFTILSSVCVLAMAAVVLLFDHVGVRGYVGLLTEPQLSYESMYLTVSQGIAGRIVWYLLSLFGAAAFCILIPKKKAGFLTVIGENAAGAYVLQGLICTVLIHANLEWYKSFRDTKGYILYLLLAVVLFLIAANPLLTGVYRKIKQLVIKVQNSVLPLEELEKHMGEKNVYSGKERMRLVLLIAGTFAYTFMIFGPYELFLSNSNNFVANFSDMWFPMLVYGILGFGVLTALLFLVKGKAGDYLLCFVAGVTLAGYLQGNYMNIYLGDLSGTLVHWEEYYEEAFFNTIIWLLLLGGVFLLYYFSKKIWKGTLTYVFLMIFAMQFVAMGSLFLTQDLSDHNSGFFSTEHEFELAKEDNIVMFVIDRMDTDYLNEILAEDPDLFVREGYDGFVYYPNCVSRYKSTFPSMTYMLTEKQFHFDTPLQQYFDEAWSEAPHLRRMLDDGYQFQLLGSFECTAGNGKCMDGLVSNYCTDQRKIPYVRFPAMMLKLLCYRDMPHILKQFFWLYTGDVNNTYTDGYMLNDSQFYQDMKTTGVSIGDFDKQLILYHLYGSHSPYWMDENAQLNEKGSDVISQTKGCVKIVTEYLDEMKRLGVYDDATIIVTADHGENEYADVTSETLNPIFMMKESGAHGDWSVSNVPIMNTDIWPTLFDEDVVSDEFCNIKLLKEDTKRVRTVYYHSGLIKDTYEVDGDGQNYENWKHIGTEKIKYDM